MNQTDPHHRLSFSAMEKIDRVCDEFEQQFRAGAAPEIEAIISAVSDIPRDAILSQLLPIEIELLHGPEGRTPEIKAAYAKRFPDDSQVVQQVFSAGDSCSFLNGNASASQKTIEIRCPHCQISMKQAVDSSFMDISCESCGSRFNIVNGDSGTPKSLKTTNIDKYRLIERVGIGSFGTVWRAKDTELDREVALKMPRRGNLPPEEQQKFLREARAAAQLEHPNIVSVHTVGRDQGTDSIYIVSDLVDGNPLSSEIADRTFSLQAATRLCETIAEALGHAHAKGVIHRDLKPHNILIDANNNPHITDFGMAKRESGEITMTMEGQVLGTPAYMPPEQASGAGHQADARADIYSLGVILFQMLTGELPFRGNLQMLIHQVRYEDAPSPRRLNGNVTRDLETICLKCLEKEPGKRYQTANALAADLGRTFRNEPILARPLGAPTRAWRWCQRNAAVAILAAAAITTLTGGLIATSVLASRLADSNTEKTKLLTRSLFDFCRLTRDSRTEGYSAEVNRAITELQQLDNPDIEKDDLRTEAVGAMGDFVGLQPVIHDTFPSEVRCFALHPDKSLMAVGLKSGMVLIVDALTKVPDSSISEVAGPVAAMRFDSNGRLLCIHKTPANPDAEFQEGEAGGTIIKLEQQHDGSWKPEFRHSIKRPFDSATLTPHGQHVTIWNTNSIGVFESASFEKIASVRVNDVLPRDSQQSGTKEPNSTENEDKDAVRSVAYSHDHGMIAIGYEKASRDPYENGLLVWDVERQKTEAHRILNLGGTYSNSISFSDGGTELVYGADRGWVVFNAPKFEQRFESLTGTNKAVDLSSDGQFLVAMEMQGNVTVSSAKSGRPVDRLAFPIRESADECIAFSDDQQLLVASSHETIKVWNLGGASERRLFPSMNDSVPTVGFSRNGKWLAAGSTDESVSITDAATGAVIAKIAAQGKVQSVRFSPDSTVLAIAQGGTGNPVELWRWIDDAKRFHHFANATQSMGHPRRVSFIDNQHFAAVCKHGVAVWNYGKCESAPDRPETLMPIKFESRKIKGREDKRQSMDLSATSKGKTLAWAEYNLGTYELRSWDWNNQKASRVLSAPRLRGGWHGTASVGETDCVAFVTRDGQLAIWDTVLDREIALLGEKDQFRSPNVSVSGDGKWVAAFSTPTSVAVWDIASRTQMLAFRPERTMIYSIDWNGNSQLALGLVDGGVVVWDIDMVQKQLNARGL